MTGPNGDYVEPPPTRTVDDGTLSQRAVQEVEDACTPKEPTTLGSNRKPGDLLGVDNVLLGSALEAGMVGVQFKVNGPVHNLRTLEILKPPPVNVDRMKDQLRYHVTQASEHLAQALDLARRIKAQQPCPAGEEQQLLEDYAEKLVEAEVARVAL